MEVSIFGSDFYICCIRVEFAVGLVCLSIQESVVVSSMSCTSAIRGSFLHPIEITLLSSSPFLHFLAFPRFSS